MARVLLTAGFPTTAHMWDEVVRRLDRQHGIEGELVELFLPAPDQADVDSLASELARRIRESSGETVVVAHGTAVPVAWRAAVAAAPAALVLSNGPVNTLDPVLTALAKSAKIPAVLAETVLRPGLFQRWLASSAGLRRTVVNPYVMDRDTVVALSDPLLATREQRLAAARFLHSLGSLPDVPPVWDGPALLCWGDGDPLYPAAIADEALRWLPQAEHRRVPGGQHYHPVERPWYIADELAAWMAEQGLTGS